MVFDCCQECSGRLSVMIARPLCDPLGRLRAACDRPPLRAPLDRLSSRRAILSSARELAFRSSLACRYTLAARVEWPIRIQAMDPG
jgi:hypothetical protein